MSRGCCGRCDREETFDFVPLYAVRQQSTTYTSAYGDDAYSYK